MVAIKIFFFVLLFIIVVPFSLLIIKLVLKSKNSSWSGVILEKGHNTKKDDDSRRVEHFYFLKVKMDNGETHNIGLSGEMWETFKEGDKIKKDKGELYPKKA